MDQAITFMSGFNSYLLPLAAASDTGGLYTVMPYTIQRLMANPFVQYFVMYYFLLASGAEPQYAFLFVILLMVLLYLEQSGFLPVGN